MTHNTNEKVKEYGRRHKLRGRWSKALAAMACLVVFCTTYALILPAITLDHKTACGLEEHTHTAEACYSQQLLCTNENSEHVHSDDCYTSTLTCELSEHQHTENCYPQETEEQTAESDTALNAETEETSEAQTEEASEKESEELVLTEQTVSAAVYTDKTYSTPSDDSVTITLKGTLPENVQVKAYPVSVNLNDDSAEVIEAYDIGLFVTVTDETTGETVEKEYEPKDSVQVKIVSYKLNDVEAVDVYHIGDAPNAEPEKVNSNVAVDENSVEFDANKFSAYVLATTAETDTKTPSDEASDENTDSDTAEEPTDSETVTKPEQNEDAKADANAANDANTVDEPTEADETGVAPQAGTYSVTVVYYDDNQSIVKSQENKELEYGIIANNLPSSVKEGYTYQGAYLTTSNTTDFTGTPIAYVTVINGETYYSVDADAKAATKLGDDKIIALHYVPTNSEVKINLTQNGATDVAGNEVKGLPSTYKTNDSFNFQVSAARGYTATVRVGNTKTTVDSGKTGTISVTTGSSDVTVNVNYTQKDTVTFDPNVFQNDTYRYLYDKGDARFTTTNNRDQTETLNTSTGASFTYTFTTKNQSTTWQVDSMKINGVYLAIPARTEGSSATTTIVPSQNDEPAMTATLTVTNVQTGYYTAYTYQLTIEGAYEDVKIDDANLNAVTWSEVIPSATEGVTFQNETSGGNSSSGLNQPVQTEDSVKPTFVFGLENGYENLEMELNAYNQDGQKQDYSSGMTNNKITLPTNTSASTTVKSGSTKIATVTKQSDGTYKIVFESKAKNSQITLQLLKVSATKKEYKVKYNVGNGIGNITDNATYDVVDKNKVVITSEKPTPPDSQYFYGWKIDGDNSGKVYFTGNSIDISDNSIQAILNAQSDTKTLKLVANYVTSLKNGDPIDVPVNIYLDDTRSADESYTVRGVFGEGLTLTGIEDTITVDGKTYKLDRHNSPLGSINLESSFDLYYVSSVDLTIAKVDNNSEPLTGAKFYMYYQDGDTKYYYSNGSWTEEEDSKSTISPDGNDATATVSGLSIGTTYYLVETKAPAGYQLLTNAITITPKNSTELAVVGNGATADGLTVKVTNQTGEALPTTGGPGTGMYTLSGILLTAIAAVGCLIYSGRKHRKGGIE